MHSRTPMKKFATFVAMALLCLLAKAGLFAQQPGSQESAGFARSGVEAPPEQEVEQIVAQSQEALNEHNEQKALTLIKEGLVRFPDNEYLKVQLARVYVEQKHDRQAMGLLHGILR